MQAAFRTCVRFPRCSVALHPLLHYARQQDCHVWCLFFVPDCQNCPDPAIIGLISYSVKCYIGANLCFEICETVAIKAGTQSTTLPRTSWSVQSMVNWCKVSLTVHCLSVLVVVSKQKRLAAGYMFPVFSVTCFSSWLGGVQPDMICCCSSPLQNQPVFSFSSSFSRQDICIHIVMLYKAL